MAHIADQRTRYRICRTQYNKQTYGFYGKSMVSPVPVLSLYDLAKSQLALAQCLIQISVDIEKMTVRNQNHCLKSLISKADHHY